MPIKFNLKDFVDGNYLGKPLVKVLNDGKVVWEKGGGDKYDSYLNLTLNGRLEDISKNNQFIRTYGTPKFTQGRKEGTLCADFDGTWAFSNDRYKNGSGDKPIGITNKLSYSFWMKTTQTTLAQIVGLGDDYNNYGNLLSITQDNTDLGLSTKFSGNSYNVKTRAPYNDGVWRHFVMTFDMDKAPNQQRLYVDSMPTQINPTQYNSAEKGNFSQSATYFGFVARTSTLHFKGQVDNFKMFTRELTQQEITNIYNDEKVENLSDTYLDISFNGDIIDRSINQQPLVTEGSGVVTFAQGRKPRTQCAVFSGSGVNNNSINRTSLNTNKITIMMWVYKDAFARDLAWLDKGNNKCGYHLYDISNKIYSKTEFEIGGSWDRISSGNLTLDSWYHVAVTIDMDKAPNHQNMYIGGVKSQQSISNSSIKGFFNDTYIRIAYGGECKIENFKMYTRELSQQEIINIYNAEL